MRRKRREREREGESEGISRGIKPKPQDISDLEGKWVKQGGWGWGVGVGARKEGGGEREDEKKERKRGNLKGRNKEMEREKRSLQRAAGKPPESSAQTNHKIPTKATKPVRGLTGVPSARNDVCAAAMVCVCGLHTFTLCACYM